MPAPRLLRARRDADMSAHRLVILCIATLSTALLLLDVTAVNVALPSLRRDLDASFAQLQWVIDAYALALAGGLLTAGVLADRFGRRRVLLAGTAVFMLASAACATATSGTGLDLARAAQGVGAAAMSAAVLALLAHEFQGRDRGIAFGVWGATTGAALAIGPLVGGLIVDGPGWRWVFMLNVPLGALLIAAGRRWLPESRDPAARRPDPFGLATFAGACVLAAYALTRGNPDGWTSTTVLAGAAGSVALLVGFVLAERRTPEPMLPFTVLRTRGLSGTVVVAFAQSVVIYPMLLFLAIYLQEGLRHSATEAGLRLLPITLALFVVAPVSGRLTTRVPLRIPLCAGLLLAAVSLLALRAGVDAGTATWRGMLPGFVLAGVAVGVMSPALASAMVAALPVQRSGLSSGITNTARQLGIAVGIAGLGALFEHHAGPQPTLASLAAGLDAVLLAAAVVALAGALPSWMLLGGLSGLTPER